MKIGQRNAAGVIVLGLAVALIGGFVVIKNQTHRASEQALFSEQGIPAVAEVIETTANLGYRLHERRGGYSHPTIRFETEKGQLIEKEWDELVVKGVSSPEKGDTIDILYLESDPYITLATGHIYDKWAWEADVSYLLLLGGGIVTIVLGGWGMFLVSRPDPKRHLD